MTTSSKFSAVRRYLFLATAVLCGIIFLLHPSDVYAKVSKDVGVDLDRGYEACTFKIKIDGGGKYDVTLISPAIRDKRYKYRCEKIDSSKYKCTVTDVAQGTWKVHVKAKKGSVGKVHVDVTGVSEKDSDIVADIKVGRDIAGFKHYMSDRTFVATWEDDNVGDVAISITNVDNNELLANDTVSDKGYRFDIPEGVKKITVSVVPATSLDIEGAAKQFTINVEHEFDAAVEFPENNFTKDSSIVATAALNKDGYGVYALVNGEKAVEQDNLSKGRYDITIPIEDQGKNEVSVYIVDKNKNRISYKKEIVKDTVAPVLTLKNDYDGMKVAVGEFILKGRVTDYSSIKINEKELPVKADGSFEYKVPVHSGENEYDIEASDEAGNKATYHAVLMGVERKASGGVSSDFIYVVVFVAAIIGIILFNKKMKARKGVISGEGAAGPSEKKSVSPKKPVKRNTANKGASAPKKSTYHAGSQVTSTGKKKIILHQPGDDM